MPNPDLYPLLLRPTLHVKIWGGRGLHTMLGKPLPSDAPYGESWEVQDSAVVRNGPLRGKSLGELTVAYGQALIGARNEPADGFPLLAKFIDAEQWLSVQVHPDDAQARELEQEPRGKTEAWVIIHAEDNARLVCGLRPGTSREDLARAIKDGTVERHLRFAEARTGDALYLPANTVHALGPGLLVYEIQQASDTTYRLYDWGRLGLDGEPRQLHIEKGLRTAQLDCGPQATRPGEGLIVDGEFFKTWRHRLRDDSMRVLTEGRFQALTCIEGAIQAEAAGNEAITLELGETGLIPASLPEFAMQGRGVVLRSSQ